MAFALITGASGGIGFALAKELALRKHDVLLVARSEELLKKNCEYLKQKYVVSADYLSIDLATAGAALRVKAWVDQKNAPVDILINNAGFTNQSKSANFDASFENFPLEDWKF